MSAILEQLCVNRLTIAERIALAQEILDSIAAEQPAPTLSEAKQQELTRRLADHKANPSDCVSWEEVEATALARFGK